MRPQDAYFRRSLPVGLDARRIDAFYPSPTGTRDYKLGPKIIQAVHQHSVYLFRVSFRVSVRVGLGLGLELGLALRLGLELRLGLI